jgi:Peptidase inhibitor family I36
MKRVFTLATMSMLGAALIGVGAASGGEPGQMRWGSEAMPPVGVCFFDNANFGGQYFCVRAGEEFAKVPEGMNDKITSLRVIGDVEAVVFKDDKFDGASGRFLTDVRDLRREGWSDRISSLQVSNAAIAWDRSRAPRWGRDEMPSEGACFYRDVNFGGEYFCMPRGASYPMVPAGFNDEISSIRLISAGTVLIFGDKEFGGGLGRVSSNAPDLRRGVWSDKISSIRVY